MEDAVGLSTDSGSCGSRTKVAEEEEAAAERCRAERNALLFTSWLLVLAMPIVTWRCIPLLVMWRLSLLLCLCCTIWSHLLDAATSVRAAVLFFANMFLLALYADAALDAAMGVLIAHLSSHLAAGMLGYALAEGRQRDGTEVSAATAVAGSPSDEKAIDKLEFVQTLGALYITLITLVFTAGVVWVVFHRADYPTEGLLLYTFLPLSAVIMLWSIYVAGVLLQGAFIEDTGVVLVVMYVVSVSLLFVMAIAIVGETSAIIFLLHGMLTSSGFLGYSLSVYTSFKLRMKLEMQPVKPNESKELSQRMLLEKKDHGNGNLHPGNNNVISNSFSTQEEAGVKSKIA